MNPQDMECVTKLQSITEIKAWWDNGHVLDVNDPLRHAVIGTAREDFNKVARFFKEKRKLVVTSRKDVKAVIFLREEYGWYGRVKIFAEQTKIDGMAIFANENGITTTKNVYYNKKNCCNNIEVIAIVYAKCCNKI